MRSSFNAFGQRSSAFGGNTPVWLGTVSPVPVGGVLAEKYAKAGILIPAGTPVNLTNGVLTPLVLFKVKSVSGNTATVIAYAPGVVPAVGEPVKTLSATGSAGSANAVTSVKAMADGTYEIGLTTAASAGNILALNAEIVPNGYLYNDIFIGAEELGETSKNVAATGAVVKVHAEGILIDRTPAAEVASYMATKVPGVVQVNG